MSINMRSPGAVLLISCYELGHQPLGIALPLGFLQRAGFAPDAIDISVEPLDAQKVARACFIGVAVPMHTALRLGTLVIKRVSEINPDAIICLYGLYAALNADYLLENNVDFCIGGECETPLVSLVEAIDRGSEPSEVEGIIQRGAEAGPFLKRLPFATPKRDVLPPLEAYARLEHNGEERTVGYVEATRGCKHLCTHCPIPPVYGGRFFAIPRNIVLEDIRSHINAGATHITFGDPDFLNGPTHSLRIVRAMHEEFPTLTFDFTAKVEHILECREMFDELGKLGCLFMISAVESLSDTVLTILEKDHTRADVEEAIEIVHGASIALRPTWVSFTPWTTLDDYIEVLEFIDQYGLIDHVDAVQYAIRLLVPPGSYLLDRPAMKHHLGELDQASFSYRWVHPDARMDELHKTVNTLVERDTRMDEDSANTFYRVWELAASMRGGPLPQRRALASDRIRAPRLTEPWFC